MDLNLKPTIVTNPHPLVGVGRQFSYSAFQEGETLGQYVERNNIELPRSAYQVFINGTLVFGDWRRLIPSADDQIVFTAVAQGGGGGGKVLRIVAMIAITIISAGYGAALGGAMGLTGSMASAVGSAIIMVAGSLVINAILPPPKPKTAGIKDKEQSPTYGISAGRNQASPYNPMQLVFGRHKIVPYLASKPYTTFVGNDQYLSQAFHFGLQPDLTLTDLKLGDTHLSNYLDVEVNRAEYDGKLSLVAGNVDTLDGFELSQGNGWIQRTTPTDTEFISADVAATLHDIADDGDERKIAVEVEAQYKVVGSTNWMPLGGTGGTTATHYWSLGYWTTETYERNTNTGETGTRQVWHQVRFGSIDPNEHTTGDTTTEKICHDEVDLFGAVRQVCKSYQWRWVAHPAASHFKSPWQGSAPDPYISYASSGFNRLEGSDPQKPTRITINQRVPKGQYDVRFRKVQADIKTTRKSNAVNIAQIRCTQTDEADYTGQARLAVRIKATSQLNGAIDTLSAIASAKCLVWNGSAWEERETSNPAWWYLWWARGKRDVNYRRLYGECLPDTRIDIDAIKAWALFCEDKKLKFNWVLDRKMSIEEVYYTIARAGRASTTWQIGKRGVIWDSATLPVVTLVTPANIIAGSYSYKVINAEVADEIVVNFHNEKLNWGKDVVRQKVPGALRTNNPITFDLEGVTDQNQAGREANLLAASQYYHRKQHTWEMDVEGAVLTRGDVCQLTHDLTSFASSGRVLAVSGNVLTLDCELPTASNGWLSLRAPNNKIAYLRVASSGFNVTVVSWPTGFPVPTDDNAIDYIWQFDPVKTAGTKLQVKSVVPQSNGNIRFEAVEYIPAYYQSENNPFSFVQLKTGGVVAPITVYSVLPSERVIDEASKQVSLSFAWVMSEQADADVSLYVNGDFIRTTRVAGYQTSITVRENDVVDIEILPFKPKRSAVKFRHQHVVAGTQIAIPAPTGLEIIGGFNKTSVRIKWDRVLSAVGYEVQVESDNGNTVRRTVKVGNALTYTYSHADMLQDGGLTRTLTFKVRALGMRESKSTWAFVTGTNPQIGQLQGVQVQSLVKSIMFTCTKPIDEDFAGYLFWISDTATFTPTLANVHFDGTFNQYFFELINGKQLTQKDYYVWAAGYDTFGKDGLNISPSYKVRPLVLQLDPQSVAADMIKDGALSINKFAESIKPPVVVTTMPTTGKVNDQVILASTGKLYRYIGGVWKLQITEVADIDSLPAGKITGQMTDAQLASLSAAKLLGVVPIANVPSIPANKVTGQMSDAQLAGISAAKLTGQIIETQISNNAITTPKIKAGAVTTNELSANAVVADKIAANAVTTAKINTGAVTANELSANAVVADKIAANAVTTVKIAANAVTANALSANAVVADKIAANAVTAAKINAGAVTTNALSANAVVAGKIAANAVTTTTIAANAVTANELAANSVTVGKVAAGAIGADQIQANSITSNKLVIRGANLIPNSDFSTVDFTDWYPLTGASVTSVMNFTSTDPRRTTAPSKFTGALSTAAGTGAARSSGAFAFSPAYNLPGAEKNEIPVKVGETYYLSLDITAGGNGTAETRHQLLCYFWDKDNKLIKNVNVYPPMIFTSIPWSWTTKEGKVVVPNGAVRMSVYVYLYATAKEAQSATLYFTNLRCLRMMDSSLVVDGAIKTQHIVTGTLHGNVLSANTVNGDRVIANTLHANRITGGTITSDKIGANQITGDKVRAKTLDASKINVSNLSAISANMGTVTAGSISIGGRFTVNTAGTVTIKSAATGQRMELDNSQLRVYDSSNRLRVRLGIW